MRVCSRSSLPPLALVVALGLAHTGCDKLGFAGKEELKAKGLDDDDGAKKTQKRDDEGAESASAAAKSSAIAPPSAAPTDVSANSTGIPECDEYVASFSKCIPDSAIAVMKVRDGLKQGAVHAREQMIKTCKEGIEGLRQACPAK